MSIPVIAIDGPTASGKGTVAARVAAALGFHYLDSGALYRLVALRVLRDGIDPADGAALAAVAAALEPTFSEGTVTLDDADVTDAIRREDVGLAASKIAIQPALRAALLDLQRGFRRAPGLVADGRDMGTVVFADAALKVFLTASAAERAARRHKQLSDKGISATIAGLLQDLQARDQRDKTRSAAPLKPAQDARLLDSSGRTIDQVVGQILEWHRAGG